MTTKCWVLLIMGSIWVPHAGAYAQFTHEELIDLTWGGSIRPLLLQRYPGATEQDLRMARSYAYGGSLIQDFGYYPFGKRLFSDLAHYVRSGDFVVSLLRNSTDLYEFAFALGALSHYIGDAIGHSLAVNPAIAIAFPRLAAEYGPSVTFEDAPIAHFRVEFGFDVRETAQHWYAGREYRQRVGFRVARRLLYRSFEETYGISARGILGAARSAVPSVRWSVTVLLPAFLSAQIVRLSPRLPPDSPGPALAAFRDAIDRSDYAARGMRAKAKPGIRPHVLAGFISIVPKIGALKVLALRTPSTATEKLFVESVVEALRDLQERIAEIRFAPDRLHLANLDLDTGSIPVAGQSKLADRAHVTLLLRVAEGRPPVPEDVAMYLSAYFSDKSRLDAVEHNPEKRRRIEAALDALARRTHNGTTDPSPR